MIRTVLLSVILFWSGWTACSAADPIIDMTVGHVRDTIEQQKDDKIFIYQITDIDGKSITTSENRTFDSNYGRGFHLVFRPITHKLPPKETTLTLEGTTRHSSPLGSIFASDLYVTGDIKFTPEAGKLYLVKGTMGSEYSAVWIEDEAGNKVTEMVERKF